MPPNDPPTARSDSSPAYTSGVRRRPSRTGHHVGTPKRSPGSRACSFSACLGSSTTRDHSPARATVGACVAFPLRKQGRHPDLWFSQLNTLPTDPSVYASTAASRLPPQDSRPGGSLLLSCKALSSSTACRLIPALPDTISPERWYNSRVSTTLSQGGPRCRSRPNVQSSFSVCF